MSRNGKVFAVGARGANQNGVNSGRIDIYQLTTAPTDYFLHETFDTDAADTQTLLDTYSLWSQIGVAPLEVDQNRLVGSQAGSWVLSGLRLDQLIPLSAHISVDIGRANSGGDHSVGVRLGDLNFSFAPGLDVSGIKGHFRVETWEGDEKIIRGVNQDMGFLPNVNVMHKFEATVSQADASASIVIIDGENSANRYEYFVTHPSLGRPYQLALTNHGHIGTGHVYHDNVIVSLINELIDSDDDGVDDDIDAFPNDPAASVDTDGDGLPDRWNPGYFAEDSTSTPALIKDMDDDGDGVLDSVDQRPLDASEAFDFDGDGIGDNADTDDDDDGYSDAEDAFPLNPFDWTDTDNDGVGDNTDAFGLDENQQSLLVAEAVSKVLDETLRQCIAAATVDLSRAQELTELGCGYDESMPPVLDLSGLEHFFNLEVINLGRAAPVSLEPLSNLNNLSELHINNVFWPIRDLSPLGQLYRLRFISFDRDEALTDGDFEALSRLRNLDEIRFGFNNELCIDRVLAQSPSVEKRAYRIRQDL